MQTAKLIIVFILLLPSAGHTKCETDSYAQQQTIQITNENGELYITYVNNIITELTVNGKPIDEDRYGNYQAILSELFKEGSIPTKTLTPQTTDKDEFLLLGLGETNVAILTLVLFMVYSISLLPILYGTDI